MDRSDQNAADQPLQTSHIEMKLRADNENETRTNPNETMDETSEIPFADNSSTAAVVTEPLLSANINKSVNNHSPNNKMDDKIPVIVPSKAMSNKKPSDDHLNDRYSIVYIILLLHGIATLMPWNMFINATEYFTEYKLITRLENGTIVESKYKEFFLSNLGIAAQVPNVLFNVLNIFFHFGESQSTTSSGNNYTVRILTAILIELVFIIVTIVMAIVDTSKWIATFFYLTMAIVIILNTVNGIYQNSIYGLASALPMKYTNAIITGNNICGTFTSLMNILTIWFSPNLRVAAIYFFSSAVFILIIAFVSFFLLKMNKYYRRYTNVTTTAPPSPPGTITSTLTSETNTGKIENQNLIPNASIGNNPESKEMMLESGNSRPPYGYIFRHVWKQCLNVFLVFFVTLSTFPVIQSGIKPINAEYFGTTESTKQYFVAVCCFLVFNSCAMFGNIVPNFVIFPGPDRLWVPVVARFLFVPFFMLCNYVPDRRTWPVLIQSDSLYIFGSVLMGLSSGYYSSLCMMYAPRSVPDQKYAGTAGMMAAASLVTGIFFGINFSYILAWLVRQ